MTLDRIVALLDRERPLGMTTAVLAIDGFGGAGKSTLAERVATATGATIVHTDDFASWDAPIQWWPRLLAEVLEPLAMNADGRYRRYDWDLGRLAEWHTVAAGGVVVIEGVTASRAAFRPYLTASVWVDTPRELRLQRGLDRDGSDARPLWEDWMRTEDEWASEEDPIARVDLVIPGS